MTKLCRGEISLSTSLIALKIMYNEIKFFGLNIKQLDLDKYAKQQEL